MEMLRMMEIKEGVKMNVSGVEMEEMKMREEIIRTSGKNEEVNVSGLDVKTSNTVISQYNTWTGREEKSVILGQCYIGIFRKMFWVAGKFLWFSRLYIL
jgi:hypothetical protein